MAPKRHWLPEYCAQPVTGCTIPTFTAAAALAALEAAMTAPDMIKEFQFQPGQIQIVNNKTIGHARTAFTDWSEPDCRRHLIRLWLRHQGRAFYNG